MPQQSWLVDGILTSIAVTRRWCPAPQRSYAALMPIGLPL